MGVRDEKLDDIVNGIDVGPGLSAWIEGMFDGVQGYTIGEIVAALVDISSAIGQRRFTGSTHGDEAHHESQDLDTTAFGGYRPLQSCEQQLAVLGGKCAVTASVNLSLP